MSRTALKRVATAPVLAIGALAIGLAYVGAFVALAMASAERKIDETLS